MKELTKEDFEAAARRLSPILLPTQLIASPFFSGESEQQVWLKPENLQLTGSFKIRGAFNRIAGLSPKEQKRGLVTASAGNHAQGVAFAAARLGVPAVIVMPEITPFFKIKSAQNYGARVILHGNVFDDAYGEARRLEREEGMTFIHPFDDREVMIGQGTIALEILRELPDCETILIPLGGGGLTAGMAVAAKQIKPGIRIIAVEPEGAACMTEALKAGKPVDLKLVSTIAEGTAVRRAGELTYPLCRDYVDEILTVSDYELMESFLLLLERHKLMAENAGLLSLAALKKLRIKGKKTVAVISGGNMDVLTVSSIIKKGLVDRGRIFRFSIPLYDRPGELEKVASIIARNKANVIELKHNQFKNLERFTQVELVVTLETNGISHIDQIVKAMEAAGYQINRED